MTTGTTYTPLAHLMSGGTSREQHKLLLAETTAFQHHTFTSWLIPGPLQTRDYARWRLREYTDMSGCPDTVEETVELRMKRRALLDDPDHAAHFVIHQNALYAAMAPAGVMKAQLAQLVDDINRFPTTIGIVPGERPCHPPMNEFWGRNWAIVEVETFTGLVQVTAPAEIALYKTVWQRYAEQAEYGAPARDIVHEALGYWTGEWR